MCLLHKTTTSVAPISKSDHPRISGAGPRRPGSSVCDVIIFRSPLRDAVDRSSIVHMMRRGGDASLAARGHLRGSNEGGEEYLKTVRSCGIGPMRRGFVEVLRFSKARNALSCHR